MANFRLDLIGRTIEAVELEAEADQEAIERGRELLAGRGEPSGVEIWERARRVATLKAK